MRHVTELVHLCVFSVALCLQLIESTETTSKPPAQTRNLTHGQTDGTFSSAKLPQTHSDWLWGGCGQRWLCRGRWKVFKKKKAQLHFMLMPEHIQTCFVVFTSLHHNLITVMRRNANLLQARAGPNQQNAIWTRLRSYNYSLFPWFLPFWIGPKAQQLISVAHLKAHPWFISVWSKLNIVHQLSERCIYEDFESINP